MAKEGETPSFWSLIRGKTKENAKQVLDDNRQILEERRQKARNHAYGVGYEWITRSEAFPGILRLCWYDVDRFFKGASFTELYRVEATSELQAEMSEYFVSQLTRAVQTWPERFFSTSGLPRAEQMEGTYDIVYYAGELQDELCQHRTARGSLHLFSSGGILTGSVEMDSRMETLDVVPYGGNFTFQETESNVPFEKTCKR